MNSEESLEMKIAGLATFEEKIAEALRWMRESISQEGTPRFREFWEARQHILPLFKEGLHPIMRSKLWGEYVELTVEARRLKEILEEQSAFSMEQIDLAIASLEEDLKNFNALLASVGDFEIPEKLNQLQRELSLLNTLASRLTGLRREILKTEMRVRFKTKFFKRLSDAGDQIFPKRKELIEQVSAAFEEQVEQFVKAHFVDGQIVGAPYFSLKEEIKHLQGMGKFLTLSSPTFSRTRLKLSACWDQIREREQEKKKGVVEKQSSGEERKKIEHEKFRLKQERIGVLKEQIALLLKEGKEMQLEELAARFEEVKKELKEIDLSKWEKQHLDRQMRTLKDLLSDRSEQALLNLSDDEKKVLENLRLVLEQKRGRRQEIKEQIELYRKALGGSGLDFEKAMLYRELIDQERERLETTDLAIEEIEEKIEARGG